jgi:hypothetical protein
MPVIRGKQEAISPKTSYCCTYEPMIASLIEFFGSDLTFKQKSSQIYRSAGTPVLLLSRPEYSEVALECLQSGKFGNFVP